MPDVPQRRDDGADLDRARAARDEAIERRFAVAPGPERQRAERGAADHERRADPRDAREDGVEEIEEP